MPARLARALGITSPQRAAVLALVICALVLSVAVPLRNYLAMQGRLDTLRAEETVLEDKVARLERRRALLESRAYTEVQARKRLGYVYPGQTPYIVQLHAPPPTDPAAGQPATDPADAWYSRLWRSLSGRDQ